MYAVCLKFHSDFFKSFKFICSLKTSQRYIYTLITSPPPPSLSFLLSLATYSSFHKVPKPFHVFLIFCSLRLTLTWAEEPTYLHLRLKNYLMVMTTRFCFKTNLFLLEVWKHTSVSQGLGYASPIVLTTNGSELPVPARQSCLCFKKLCIDILQPYLCFKRLYGHL